MFTWPSEKILPRCSTDFGNNVAGSVDRTEMQAGAIRQQQAFTSGLKVLPVSWVFDNKQYSIFQAIVAHKLNGGADWFEMPVPVGDADDSEEATFAVQTVRIIKGAYSVKYQDVMHWKVSAQLETENLSPMTSEELDAELALDV